jgi:hypothetical protein
MPNNFRKAPTLRSDGHLFGSLIHFGEQQSERLKRDTVPWTDAPDEIRIFRRVRPTPAWKDQNPDCASSGPLVAHRKGDNKIWLVAGSIFHAEPPKSETQLLGGCPGGGRWPCCRCIIV